MDELKEEGRSILMISHDLEETMRISDTISVLRDGEMIGTVNAQEVSEDNLKKMMVGRELTMTYPTRNVTLGETILEVKYNRVLPPYIVDLLSFACPEAVQTAVSKYTLCRQYEGKE